MEADFKPDEAEPLSVPMIDDWRMRSNVIGSGHHGVIDAPGQPLLFFIS